MKSLKLLTYFYIHYFPTGYSSALPLSKTFFCSVSYPIKIYKLVRSTKTMEEKRCTKILR